MKEFSPLIKEYKKEKNKNRVELDVEEWKVHYKRSVKSKSYKDDKKCSSNVSNEVIVNIFNRFSPLSANDEDMIDNNFSNIVIENTTVKKKEREKKKNKISKIYNDKTKEIIQGEEPR